MGASALPRDAGEPPPRVRFLSLVELQPRSDVGRLVRLARLWIAARQLVEDPHRLGIVAATRAIAGEEQACRGRNALRASLPCNEQGGARFGAAAVRREGPRVDELGLGGIGAAQCLGRCLGLRHRRSRLSRAEEPLRAGQQLASGRIGQREIGDGREALFFATRPFGRRMLGVLEPERPPLQRCLAREGRLAPVDPGREGLRADQLESDADIARLARILGCLARLFDGFCEPSRPEKGVGEQRRRANARRPVGVALRRGLERLDRVRRLAREDQRFSLQLRGMHARLSGPGEVQRFGGLGEAAQSEQGASPDQRAAGVGQASRRPGDRFLRPARGQGGACLLGCLLANLRASGEKRRERGTRRKNCHAVTKACIQGARCLDSVGYPSTGAV